MRRLLLLPLLLLALCAWPLAVAAAEVQQVRTATLLQVGDSNRSYTVRLACIAVDGADEQAALAWLRQAAPRGTRVNLRPMGEADGALLARVTGLPRRRQADAGGVDLGAGLVEQGLAQASSAGPAGCR